MTNPELLIDVSHLSRRYGRKLAVDDLTFTVRPGRVTGFLGPNGAGKSSTMRMILGLDHPDSGTATIGGRPYSELRNPLRTVGALLEANAVHKGRTAANHLLWLAQSQGLPRSRVREVLREVGLTDVAGKRAGGFSLGMGARLGIAAALLGDPEVLILDEPTNGLDPEGVLWLRTLLQERARAGATVLLSSHLMNEMAVAADHLVVIGRGRLIADCPTVEFIERSSGKSVLIKSPDAPRLTETLRRAGATVAVHDDGLLAQGLAVKEIAELAAGQRIIIYELTPQRASLEDAFMKLTRDSVEYDGSTSND
jgi:ABC-2 type transport system ATP-binding protein